MTELDVIIKWAKVKHLRITLEEAEELKDLLSLLRKQHAKLDTEESFDGPHSLNSYKDVEEEQGQEQAKPTLSRICEKCNKGYELPLH